jgi:hypothetical protein
LAKHTHIISIKFRSLFIHATLKFYSVIVTLYATTIFSTRIVSLTFSWLFGKLSWLLDKSDARL